ncbi:ABC transporter G family member 28-like [Lycium ferocissimum]|uniref:ABC transporter G family member 28-like n=1 Tax=Lycium ferocissimum TaxID=112874 RepID=UPI002815629C|nr:ABC transporter G family member 28-like [Lycium ferocissimum]
MCRLKQGNPNNVFIHIFLSFAILLIMANFAYGQQPTSNNSMGMTLVKSVLASRIKNLSTIMTKNLKGQMDFCIENVDKEWDAAFNFSDNSGFLEGCLKQTKGGVQQRLCTVAEIKFYSTSLLEVADESGAARSSNYLRPNKNCNLSSWISGCEPGWACSAGNDTKIDFENDKEIPSRTLDCQSCCEGFFCPHGLTCMIPCPMGAYCPLSKLNTTTGICDPYRYQLPPGDANHTCGGADMWADFMSATELFCSAGFYCPTAVQKIPCNKGYYCRAGSTEQTSCYKFATCERQTANQNITYYGIMLFGAIMLILLIIYNCSDQVLSSRERKQAKSREAGARSARESAQAQNNWKSNLASMGSQLSKTFSRRKSTRQDVQKDSDQFKPGKDSGLPLPPGMSQAKAKKQHNLKKMINASEENPDSEASNIETGDKKFKKDKGKQLHSRTQIFRYAYGQIEKEKALQEQNKDMTFSGVVNMASEFEIRPRPPIEIHFKDLTLTLKGKNKHLLRCVTGTLSPGRVSAVMGPSGAGKTTFLSALTGKAAAGCTTTGSILINGKSDSIQSYKKVIGFVPQDDIVHGNLTVEENLWFSARCRLAADLAKPEKVLVVERVIESLGLQQVRDSLVGTVEKRGISGGQRKRVNVGLEMVIEPSLLILDEPTSGLDSTSSQLLLRALRREALEGVNICMVLHQPSYTLFRMFDDFILLAKGGLTAYHGPVSKVEEYFSGLGINVPDRVNPPDHFIDILEGIYKLPTSIGVSYKDLPLRWMLHNGYAVPPDMLGSSGSAASSAGDNSAHGGSSAAIGPDQSFAGELWSDVKSNVEQKKDHIQHRLLSSHDLSNRKTPGVLLQYRYFLGRLGKQRLREARIQSVDYLILLLAGICLGTLAKVSDESFGAQGYLYTVIAVSLLGKIAALRSFALDKVYYWRESASGMSSLAYFMAKDTLDHFSTIVKPAVYLSMFYFFNNPRSTIWDNYIILLCLTYCVTGIAYALAIYFEPGPAQLWSVLLPVVLTLVANQDGDPLMAKIGDYCYPKWALEAFLLATARRYSGVWLISRCGLLKSRNYDLNDWYYCLLYLILVGILSRCVAFFCLVMFQKK